VAAGLKKPEGGGLGVRSKLESGAGHGAARTRARVRLGATGGGGDRWPPLVGSRGRGARAAAALGHCWAGAGAGRPSGSAQEERNVFFEIFSCTKINPEISR
jgi:hypothetical protein